MTPNPAPPRHPATRSLRWTAAIAALPALSIRQPYAWLVIRGIKDVENRTRRLINLPKRVLIHASTNLSDLHEDVAEQITRKTGHLFSPDQAFDIGGIIGVATIIACQRRHPSAWKEPACWGWVLADASPLPFRECKGAVGFFYPDLGV